MSTQKKALIAMSGGVDSSVAVYLMQKAGYACMGVTMRLFEVHTTEPKTNDTNVSSGISDSGLPIADNTGDDRPIITSLSNNAEDAKAVADSFGIPHRELDFCKDFEKEVIGRFVHSYIEGETPNPCVACNRYMKFAKLMQYMHEQQFDYIVTGHYARIVRDENSGRYLLKKGLDASKDQSYVLYNLTQEQLAHTIFPLGSYHKDEIRDIAKKLQLVNAEKSDSQDICFVPDGKYADFIENYCHREFPNGDFVTTGGEVLGKHKGLIRYTTGQRKGLGLSLKEPLYVVKKDMEKNQVILGRNEELFTTVLEADDLNWISIESLTEPMRCTAKARYKQKEAPALLEPVKNGRIRLTFDEPQRAVTAGQAVVFYDNDVVIGGGKIVD